MTRDETSALIARILDELHGDARPNVLDPVEDAIEGLHAEVERLRLEIRRIHAAEEPGSDDAAFEGTGWTGTAEQGVSDGYTTRACWTHTSGARVLVDDLRSAGLVFTDMRAAVPGSV